MKKTPFVYVLGAALVLFSGLLAWQVAPTSQANTGLETSLAVVSPADSLVAATAAPMAVAAFEHTPERIRRLPAVPPTKIDGETLWLARTIYSETKLPEEQELVAWVIRNRVETGYRGKHGYQAVVLDPYQFSAFNLNSLKRRFYMNLTAESTAPGWQLTLRIAHFVRHAAPALRPFSKETRHFYSERSLQEGILHPEWALGKPTVQPERMFDLDHRRFRFLEGVM